MQDCCEKVLFLKLSGAVVFTETSTRNQTEKEGSSVFCLPVLELSKMKKVSVKINPV